MTASVHVPTGPKPEPPLRAAAPASYEDWLAVMEALRNGDRVALAKVSRLITGCLVRYRGRALADDACDDIRQEALLALSQSVQQGSLRDPRAFVAYAGAMVRNMLLVRVRSEKRRVALAHRVREIRAAAGSPPCEHEQSLRIDLERALDKLPERQRLVVEALYVRGLRYAEAAQELGMPLGTLKGLQVQGLVGLRRALGVGEQDA